MMSIDNETQNILIHAVDQEGGKIEDVITKWVAESESVWKPWVDAAMAAKQ